MLKLNDLKIDKIKIFKNQQNPNNIGYISDEEYFNCCNWLKQNINVPELFFEKDMQDAYVMIDGKGIITTKSNDEHPLDFKNNPSVLYECLHKVANSKSYSDRCINKTLEKETNENG